MLLLAMVLLGIADASGQTWSLQQCIDTAQVHNRTLQMSRNSMEISRQKQKEVEAGLLPKANAVVDYKYFIELPYQLMPMSVFGGQDGKFKEAQFGVPHNLNANVQVSMPLHQPQLNGAIKTARIGGELASLQYRKTEEQVYFEVANLYYNAQVIRSQLAFVESNLRNSRKLLGNMQLLKEQQMAKGTDVNKVALQTEQLVTQGEQLESQYGQVVNALKVAIGLPMEQPVEVEERIAYQHAEEYGLQPIIDIQLAKTQNRLLASELNTLRSTYKPSVSLYGTFGTTGYGYDKKGDDFLKFYPSGFTGLQVAVPLFNGTVTKRKIRQKALELQNNELQQSLLAEQNQVQVINARNQKNVARRAIETTGSQIKLAQDIYEQTLLQQKQGVATLTDVLLADNDLQGAQQKHLVAIVDYLKADLELKKSTGNLLNK